MIKLSSLFLSNNDTSLNCYVNIDGIDTKIWFSVSNEYAEFLCVERSDAYIVGLLYYALKFNHDIYYETPISESLYYQLTHFLIPTLSKYGESFHSISICGPISEDLPKGLGAVGTGISSGIDSFYTIFNNENDDISKFKITHLTFFNVGSHGYSDNASALFNNRYKRAVSFCRNYNYPLVRCDSNLHMVLKQEHLYSHTYSSCFAVLNLQKLFSIYLYASSGPLCKFNILNCDQNPSSYYEFLLLKMFSTSNLRFYSEGLDVNRLCKTLKVSEYTPSYKYLNVCTSSNSNCGVCEKCKRTLLALEISGVLDNYSSVFNLEYYRRNRKKYLRFLYLQCFLGNDYYIEMYPYFKKDINLYDKLTTIPDIIVTYLKVIAKKYLSESQVIKLKSVLKNEKSFS